jgi:hypothetical protein
MSDEISGGVDLSSLGSFDFTPAWAKNGEKKVTVGNERQQESESEARRPMRRGDGAPRAMRPQSGGRNGEGFRRGGDFKGAPRPQRQRREDRPAPLDAEIKVLPESKALGTIIRRLQNDVHAYKLKDLAYFFLDNPGSVSLKITPRDPQAQSFYQCKACGFASMREEEVVSHAIAAHLGDYFDSREIETEPPKGSFPCVARCGLSGVLLGPPNIHEFAATVREIISTKYPRMSEAEYRSHIEMVRDPEVVEEWRKQAVKKTVFFAKGRADEEGAPSVDRERAEGEFRRSFLPSLVVRVKNLMITAEAALKSPDAPIVRAAGAALESERRAPYGMCLALRGAFRHRGLKFFRVNDARGQEFVTNTVYKEFDTEHAIAELASVAKFLAANPCLDKSEFPEQPDFEKHLNWLVSTGHAVAFTNGVFSIVEKFPKYGPQWKKRAKKQAAENAEAEKPAEEAQPAADEPKAEVQVDAEAQVVEEPVAQMAEAPKAEETAIQETTSNEEQKDEASTQLA